jgi:hypothetical protein
MVSVLSILIISGAFLLAYFTILKNTKESYANEIKLLEEQLIAREVYVYEAKEVIPSGSIITKDNLKYVKSYSNQSQEYFMTEKEIGMTALIQIEPGTQILKGMLTKNQLEENVREVEYDVFLINSNIKDDDCIDLRLLLPNGEDYIVLSKKGIKQVDIASNNCFLWLTEEEILTMSSAVVDAFLYPGSKLYTTKYVEPRLQEPSILTYQPSLATLTLMEENENIVETASIAVRRQLRRELEERLEKLVNKDISNSNLQTDFSYADSLSEKPVTGSGDTTYVESDKDESDKDESYKDEFYFDESNEEVIVEYGG